MDFFSHGLWAALAAAAANQKINKFADGEPPHHNNGKYYFISKIILDWCGGKPLKIKWFAFWGVFPDLFSFAIPFVWFFAGVIFGWLNVSDLPGPQEVEPARPDTAFIFRLSSFLYNLSHSFAIFVLVFGLLYLFLRRPVWELGGWFLHILIDIPTHTYRFYPTPFLWPLSDWKLDGFSWANWPFMILNVSLMTVVYYLLAKNGRKIKNTADAAAGKLLQ